MESKRLISEEEDFTEANYTFTLKANFSTLGSIREISSQGPLISFLPDESLRYFSRFNATTIYEEYNLSSNHVDILSYVKNFFEGDIAQGMILKWNDQE